MISWKWKIRSIFIFAALGLAILIALEDLLGQGDVLGLNAFAGSFFVGEKCSITTISSISDEGIFFGEAVPGPTIFVLRENRTILNSKNWYCPLGYDQVPDYKDPRPRVFQVVPVRWGDRRYLLSDYDFEEETRFFHFCASIRAGMEPRERAHGNYYLMHGDWDRQVFGNPVTIWGEQVCSL